MAEDYFHSINSVSEGLYKEKGSKFLAFAYPVRNDDQVNEHIQKLKNEFHDARHHCYAFIMGQNRDYFRTHDAGEPAHSAGDPILNEIRSREITNVLVVVVRYFGGTKLGIPGLINAYKSAARDALDNAVITKIAVTSRFTIEYDYAATNDVMKLTGQLEATIVDQEFGEQCRMTVTVPKSRSGKAMDLFKILEDKGIVELKDK